MSDRTREAAARLAAAGGRPPAVATAAPEPLWEGPTSPGDNGGVTYSLLSRFMACRERFRVQAILGLRPAPRFSHRIEYGNMWHVCEEAFAAGHGLAGPARLAAALEALTRYARGLAGRHPTEQGQVDHWYRLCRAQFPAYVEYWAAHPHRARGTPLLKEEVFDVWHLLPDGRRVRLRGKFDSVDYVSGPDGGIWLQENKTKGDVDEDDVSRQLTMDLQTMLYLRALYAYAAVRPLRDAARAAGAGASVSIVGVRYNVVRRPLSGGRGTISRHKPTKRNPRGEGLDDYYRRVAAYFHQEPGRYFMRWQAVVSRDEVRVFCRQVLDPLLTQLCDWYDAVAAAARESRDPFSLPGGVHWRHPYGARNPIDEGYAGDVDAYLAGGGTLGLVRAETLFPELAPPEADAGGV